MVDKLWASVAYEALAALAALPEVKLQQASNLTALGTTPARNQSFEAGVASLAGRDRTETVAKLASRDVYQCFADLAAQSLALFAVRCAALPSVLHRCEICSDLGRPHRLALLHSACPSVLW